MPYIFSLGPFFAFYAIKLSNLGFEILFSPQFQSFSFYEIPFCQYFSMMSERKAKFLALTARVA